VSSPLHVPAHAVPWSFGVPPRTTPTEAVPQPYRYTGAYLDPTGLYKMGARYYDPQAGRFTQPDPSDRQGFGVVA
jgi:RHS repeat-associated protein